jgi:DNA-binding CsgD family transcriptional regulator
LEQLLSFLVDAYDALSDKTSLYALGLRATIKERTAELRSNIRRAGGRVSETEQWTLGRFDAALSALDQALPIALESLFERADSTGRCNTIEAVWAAGVLHMKYRTRIYYSESQKALMWERWRKGESLQHIAQLFDRNHSSIQRILAETGGIQPAPRRRSRLALTLAEREEISRSLVAGHSIRSVASRLGRAPSTISREIRRNGGVHGYRANQADTLAWDRGRRPKACKLVGNRELAQVVASKLRLQWSPEQIAGWLKHSYAVNKDYQVSHETIYRSLYYRLAVR